MFRELYRELSLSAKNVVYNNEQSGRHDTGETPLTRDLAIDILFVRKKQNYGQTDRLHRSAKTQGGGTNGRSPA